MRKVAFILSFAVFFLPTALSQTSLSSSGGNATGAAGSLSYTMGQAGYVTLTGATGTATEGVQQPFIISSPTGTAPDAFSLRWIAYPNPVNESLTLETGNIITGDLSYKLTDMYGRSVKNGRITSGSMTISFSELPPGTYFLRIFITDREIKIFKIVKL